MWSRMTDRPIQTFGKPLPNVEVRVVDPDSLDIVATVSGKVQNSALAKRKPKEVSTSFSLPLNCEVHARTLSREFRLQAARRQLLKQPLI